MVLTLEPGFAFGGGKMMLHEENIIIRMAELKRKADFASIFGIEANYLNTAEIEEQWPLMDPEGVLGGIYMPSDGSVNPVDLTTVLAKWARSREAKILEGIKVEEVLVNEGKASGVRTDQGTITTDFVVNCAGIWARELGQKNGVVSRCMLASITTLLPTR